MLKQTGRKRFSHLGSDEEEGMKWKGEGKCKQLN